MISYAPFWETMEKRGAATYTLQYKGGISSSTIRRLNANESVSTNTLDALCQILDCTLDDIVTYLRTMKGYLKIEAAWNDVQKLGRPEAGGLRRGSMVPFAVGARSAMVLTMSVPSGPMWASAPSVSKKSFRHAVRIFKL